VPPIQISIESSQQLVLFLSTIGVISSSDAKTIITSSEESNQDAIEALIHTGLVDELQICNAISSTYGFETAHIKSEADVDHEIFDLLPFNFILRNRILPFREGDSGEIHLAISDNTTINLISSVKTIINKNIKAVVIPLSDMDSILSSFEASKPPALRVINDDPLDIMLIEENDFEASSSTVIDFVDSMITEAVNIGVSDIHIEIFKNFARLRYRLDGVLTVVEDVSEELFEFYAAITTRIKVLAFLDIAERRLPQDGGMSLEMKGRNVDFRVSVLPTGFGERVVLRILDRSAISLSIEKLCLADADEQALIHAVESPQGLVLVTGPTGSGKSTTLYAILDRINQVGVNVLTAEDPVEYSIDGVGQVQIKEKIGLTFSAALRSFLRQDPEVIMIGEIRDKETVDIVVKSALTGHLVLSTLHTNDSVSSISRLLDMGVAPYLVSSALTLVVAQRLVRVVCPDCKTKDISVTINQLQGIGFSKDEASTVTPYNGEGCLSCNGLGVKGRRGLYEVLRITNNIKEGILLNKTTIELLRMAQSKDGFKTIQEIGREMLVNGELSVAEYQRVIMNF